MSAEESNTDSDNSNDEVSSEEDVADDKQRKPSQKKKIFVRPPSWRSDKYNNILHKLDRNQGEGPHQHQKQWRGIDLKGL